MLQAEGAYQLRPHLGLRPDHGGKGFRLEGRFLLSSQPEKAVCILRETGRKEFTLNDEPYSRFSKHIGRYPCVVIAPDDVELILGFIRELAEYERAPEQVVATPELIHQGLFGPEAKAKSLIGELNGRPAGFAEK